MSPFGRDADPGPAAGKEEADGEGWEELEETEGREAVGEDNFVTLEAMAEASRLPTVVYCNETGTSAVLGGTLAGRGLERTGSNDVLGAGGAIRTGVVCTEVPTDLTKGEAPVCRTEDSELSTGERATPRLLPLPELAGAAAIVSLSAVFVPRGGQAVTFCGSVPLFMGGRTLLLSLVLPVAVTMGLAIGIDARVDVGWLMSGVLTGLPT